MTQRRFETWSSFATPKIVSVVMLNSWRSVPFRPWTSLADTYKIPVLGYPEPRSWSRKLALIRPDLLESNGSLPPGLWLTSPAGWLPRTAISSGTLRSVIEYGLPLPLRVSHYGHYTHPKIFFQNSVITEACLLAPPCDSGLDKTSTKIVKEALLELSDKSQSGDMM